MHRINGPSLFIGHGGWREPKKKYICTFIISELLAIYPVLLPGEQFPISGVSFVALFWQGRLCVPGLLAGVVSPGSEFPSLRISDNMASFASVFDFDRGANITHLHHLGVYH